MGKPTGRSMLNCRQTSELCSQELDRGLSLPEQLALTTHLMMCRRCSNFRRQIRLLHEAASAYSEGRVDLPPDSTTRESEAAE